MKKMTSEEYDKVIFQEFMDSLKGVLDESVDISKACTVIHSVVCYTDAYLNKIDEKDASYLIGIWSELEEFPKDNKRLNYTTEELSKLDQKERKKIDWYKADLQDICRKILASEIPNMGPPTEDPLSWPYSNDRW